MYNIPDDFLGVFLQLRRCSVTNERHWARLLAPFGQGVQDPVRWDRLLKLIHRDIIRRPERYLNLGARDDKTIYFVVEWGDACIACGLVLKAMKFFLCATCAKGQLHHDLKNWALARLPIAADYFIRPKLAEKYTERP
jgi:hypothetical protein